MFKNFFKIVVRNLWRYKSYTLINIIGMGIGIAAMVWGYQTYRFAFSFDNFHPDRENVYRALTEKDGADDIKGVFPSAIVQAAKNEFPGIKATVRLDSRGMNIKSVKGEAFAEQVHFTDPLFFNFFNFPLISGNNNLNDRSAVLITEKTAKKYFGNENPIGKTLIFYAGETYAMPFTIKGVLKDIPVNSTIQFSFLTNFDNQLKPDGTKIAPDDWSWFVDAAFFKIPNPADANSLAASMKKYLSLQNKAREDWKASGFKLLTLRENAAQVDRIGSNGLFQRPDDAAAYGPLVFAFLILLSACLNFSNTTVARANTRLKEIGMRKVMGSTYRQLIVQMLLECSVIVLFAIALSVLLNTWWLPAFNKMFVFVDVKANYLHDTNLLVYLAIMLVVCTLLAGAYPAFYISRFNASSIFRGNVKFGGSNLFSRLMLGLQLAISIITVVAGIAFAKNAAFQKTYDFGYNLENTMGITVSDQNTFDVMKNEMKNVPQVTALAGTRHHIGFGYRNLVAEAEGIKKETDYLEVGSDYLKVMNLKMVNGRSFDPSMISDYSNAILVTQKMAAMFGWKDGEALGKQVHIDTVTYSVIGVLKDFHSNNLFDPLEPVVMKLVKEDKFQYLIIQSKPADLAGVYAQTKATWEKLFPLKPFNGFYQNEITAESYRVSTSIAEIFSWFSIVSVLLTATGLFALVSLTMLKKMKEIALRRVVGAAPRHILLLLNKGYFWIFIISAFLGCYGGWALTKLLLDTIFKINVGVESSTLIVSVVVLFLITACTTGIKVWQAIRTNPVKLLRME
jgi:ABC-type antimicrobial peptide transport system permease subunit